MNKWPKELPQLTPEQLKIKDDFMRHWHEVLPSRYGMIERFNHGYPRRYRRTGERVLEIGAGLGEHIAWEDPDGLEYWALELRPEMASLIRKRFPSVNVIEADCQKHIDFPDGHFDRILAIHVLEHLPDLPATIRELHRLLKPDGRLVVVIPCEGGLAYSLARRISAQRIFEKRYGMKYDWFIQSEHINRPHEIREELAPYFDPADQAYFPLRIASVPLNLVIGMFLQPKRRA
jgi:SAM-dependent methyltransferase